MSGTREKFNAVFLAAVMVLSMVAFSTAFAGSAAALQNDADIDTSQDVTTAGVDTGLEVSLSNISGNYTGTSQGSIEALSVDLSAYSGSADLTSLTGNDVNISIDGTDATDAGIGVADYNVVVDPDGTSNNALVAFEFVDGSGTPVAVDFNGNDTATIDIANSGNFTNPTTTDSDTAVVVGFHPTSADPADDATTDTDGYSVTAPSVEVTPDPGVTTVGSAVDYTVNVTDSNNEGIDGASVDIANAGGTDNLTDDSTGASNLSTTISTGSDGLATISLQNVTATGGDGIGTFDFTATEQLSSDAVSQTVTHQSSSQNTVLIQGEISNDANPPEELDDSGNVSITITSDGPIGTIVDSRNISEFDTLANDNSLVEEASFSDNGGDPGTYQVRLQSSQSQIYTFDAEPVGALTGQVEAFDGPTRNIAPGQSDTRNLRLSEVINPTDINVVNVDPSSTPDIEQTVDVTVEVTSADLGGSVLSDTPVQASVNNSETTSGVANFNNIDINGTATDETKNTDSNGQATFSVSVDGSPVSDIEEVIETQIEFTATDGNNVQTSQDLEFIPSVGDTGTLSGTVDVVDENVTLGTQSNIENTAGVEVHAVQEDRVLSDSVRVVDQSDNGNAVVESINSTNISDTLDQIGIDDFDDADASIVTPTFSGGVAGEETGLGDVELDTGDQFRVVTFEDGEEVTLDPRSNYLVRNPSSVELIENESDQSVEIFDNDGGSPAEFELAFLSNASYQVQQKVVIQNDSTEETVSVFQNITVDEGPNNGPLQANTEDVFDASEDLTYEGVENRFDDSDRTVQTDTTNEQGNFELLNLPTDAGSAQDYVVMAGGSDTGTANTEYGFANFAGYDTVAVEANTAGSQLDTDLSVQEFEPVNQFAYNLDVTVDNGAKSVEAPIDEPVSVEVSATQRELGTNDEQPAEGIEITLEALNSNIGELADTTPVLDSNGEATTTFTGDSPQVGQTNISATFDAPSGPVSTEGGEQATVDIFQDAQITGDVVDDSTPSDNLPGAEVTLTEENATGTFVEIANTTAGPAGSFSFTGEDGVRSGENYTVEASFTDEEGNEGTGFAQIFEIPGGTTNADIVIEDVIAPEGFEVEDGSLEAPASAAPGEEIEVSANVTNTAGEEATSPVTFVFDGSDVEDQDVTLDAGATDPVSFTVTVPDVADGDYEHGIETDIDSETATITVEEDAPAYYTLKLSNSIADRAAQTTTISTFANHRQSGSTALLPRSVYRYTRTHTGGLR
ncbi:beta strand repeat-containing protein [Halonotius pteroides]|uniref:Cell surface glycoprotein n=1 Tax=Halonotius pteroides TaxID=268735 RepID=A0A3A6QKB2_9EURY|nr:surface glycoprotein [Halonotius pteroides]RJX47814.1 cell surface glycoprotein [Halonotius pteroides]